LLTTRSRPGLGATAKPNTPRFAMSQFREGINAD
jgi:hypothetical protein